MKYVLFTVVSVILATSFFVYRYQRSSQPISSIEVARIAETNSVGKDGITEKTKKKLSEAPTLKSLHKRIEDKEEAEILEGGTLIAARSVQRTLGNPYDKSIDSEELIKTFFMMDCFATLWGDEGIGAIGEVVAAPIDNAEKQALMLISDKQFAMQTFRSSHPSKEECLKAVRAK